MTRTGQAAIDYARSRVGPNAMPASGYCLQFVRECFAVSSYYASAIDAWNGAQYKHPGDRNFPPAVPLFFTSPSVYDHVTFGSVTGEIITTFNDDVRKYNASSNSAVIDQIIRDFGPGSYLGWAEDINRVRVYTPGPTPEPEPEPQEEDDMAVHIWNGNTGDALIVGGRFVPLSSGDTVNQINSSTIPRIVVSDREWAAFQAWSPSVIMLVEPSRGYALLAGTRLTPIGDMSTVYALRGAGVPETTINAGDWDRLVDSISDSIGDFVNDVINKVRLGTPERSRRRRRWADEDEGDEA